MILVLHDCQAATQTLDVEQEGIWGLLELNQFC
jgi:hypothetical protein